VLSAGFPLVFLLKQLPGMLKTIFRFEAEQEFYKKL
jgi:hypothetical protein